MNNLQEDLDPETENEVSLLVDQMYSYRGSNNLPEPTDEEVQELIEYYLSVKEASQVFDIIASGDAFLDITEDGVDLIDSDTEQPMTGCGECEHCLAQVQAGITDIADKRKLN
jgi:hypothetical protein